MKNSKNEHRLRPARTPDFSAARTGGDSIAERRDSGGGKNERDRYSRDRSAAMNEERYGIAGESTRNVQSRSINYGRRSSRSAEFPSRRGGALTRREERELIEAKREKKWQSEVERVRGGVDKIMLSIIIVLLGLGALMVYSASYPTALLETGDDSLYYLKKHLIYMAIGAVLMILASAVPYRYYKNWGPFAAYGVSVLLLLAVLVIGTSEREAKRWIYIGSFSIQPSEIMKVSLVLILAWYIDRYQNRIRERNRFFETYKYNTLYPMIFVGIACILVLLEKHLSGTVIIGLLGVSVMLVGGCHMKYTLATTAVGGAAAVALFIAKNPYALKRILTFTSEDVDVLNEGWQTTQGIFAIGSGGLFGLGFSESRQKFSYVSMAHNDFIFTIWCEELGFVGAVLLILLFVAFVWRGYVIAMRAPDTFSMLTVFGITTQVGLQAFLNMMVVCDIIPNTGISLPFFSYGGSSLVMLMAEMGVVLSVSRQYYRRK